MYDFNFLSLNELKDKLRDNMIQVNLVGRCEFYLNDHRHRTTGKYMRNTNPRVHPLSGLSVVYRSHARIRSQHDSLMIVL